MPVARHSLYFLYFFLFLLYFLIFFIFSSSSSPYLFPLFSHLSFSLLFFLLNLHPYLYSSLLPLNFTILPIPPSILFSPFCILLTSSAYLLCINSLKGIIFLPLSKIFKSFFPFKPNFQIIF